MNEREKRRCERCGKRFESCSLMMFDGKPICANCLERETVLCERCGKRIWSSDNAGAKSLPLCRNCYTEHYTVCQNCGRVIRQDDAHYYNGYDEDGAYCENCFSGGEKDSGEEDDGDRGYKSKSTLFGEGKGFLDLELNINGSDKSSIRFKHNLNFNSTWKLR